MIYKILEVSLIFFIIITSSFSSEIDHPQEQDFLDFKSSVLEKAAPAKQILDNKNSFAQVKFNFEQTPVPAYIHDKGYGVLEGIIYPKNQQYMGKLPISKESMNDSRTGIFLTQPPIGYVLYRSKPDSQFFDRLLIDSNLNDTLSDEVPIIISDISKRTSVKLVFSGKPEMFDLQLGSKGVKLYPKFWKEGVITLKDKKYHAAIFKSTYGTNYQYGVVLLIDFNNDGIYATSEFEFLTEAFLLQKIMVLKKRFYNSDISKSGDTLILKKLDSAYGQISFVLPDSAKAMINSYKFSFLPQGGSGRDILKVALKEFPVNLPVGRYGIIEGLAYDKDFKVLLKFACPEFNILKAKRLKLKLTSARMDALARQDNNKLIAAQKTYGPRNIYYNLVGPANPKDPGPELLIYNTENKSEIYFSDNLEYG